MKHLKHFERVNTKYWYGKMIPTKNKEEFITYFFKIVTNINIEEIKLVDYFRSKINCFILIYTTKAEKEKNFKDWKQHSEKDLIKFNVLGDIYSNDEIDDWIENWETRIDINKYNL